ncbi:HAUS augmin-like complex subunit 6 N-terminus-domain-containing protein [Peziza echinospora]|nr:HAUS augmin-like complex subunit 6 N-terminus-domain-containing protein [Peziza echinospora]
MKSSPAVSLLLTNLQLLDYYSSEDAFPISVETFTSLKNKGKAFEHIVHHLFQVYQPNEAATRFQGCWPIYEPVQSRELRNVVFKWLTDLKRSGLLQTGGNVIIRRSLFDDCSGERYEELLLALSTMVLRNQVERGVFKEPKHQTIAYKQCHTHTPNLGLLTPLILAHQSSLTRLLNSRNNSKEQWRLFVSFLKQREAELELSASHLPPDAANLEGNSQQEEDIIAKWKNNWLGDTRWLDILFDGNSDGRRDKLLESGYDRAFAKYKNISQEGSGKASSASGLVGLERQVEEQRTRVGELRKLRESAMKSLAEIKGTELELQSDESPETKDTPKGLGVIFSRHANLRIKPEESTSRASAIPANDADDGNEYSILLEDLRAELEAVDSAKRKRKTRPIVTPFRPPILDNGIEHLARKTLLPQPASKVSRPGTLLPKASSSYLSGRAAGVPGTKPVANTPPTPVPASDPQSPKLQKNIFGTALPKTPPGLEEDEIDFAAFARTPNTNAEKVVEKKLMFDSALPKLPPPRSIPRSNSLKSPERMQLRSRDSSNNLTNKSPERLQLRSKDSTSNMSLKSPERMQLRPRDSASNLALKSPDRIPLPSRESSSNPSPTPSDEQFSEIDDSVLMTPHRSRATTRTPLTSQSSSTSQSTPKAARTLSYGGDEELTPRALRYSSTPRTGTAPKLSAGFEDSEIAADKVCTFSPLIRFSRILD